MSMISSTDEVNTLAAKEPTTGGVYFVTAFNGLLAPYWDSGAAGLLIGTSHFSSFNTLTQSFNLSHLYSRYLPVYQPVTYRPCDH
jgi:glycerol kinase